MGATVQVRCVVSRAGLCVPGYDGGGEEDALQYRDTVFLKLNSEALKSWGYYEYNSFQCMALELHTVQ